MELVQEVAKGSQPLAQKSPHPVSSSPCRQWVPLWWVFSSPTSLGSKVFDEPLEGRGQADGWGQLLPQPLPHGQGPPAPSVTAHPGPCIRPPFLLIPSGFFPVLPALGHIFQILEPLLLPLQIPQPPRPIPTMGKAAPARTHARSWAGRGEDQLAGPGSCEVWGCQGEEPRLRGRHGKAVRECYPEPLLPPARSAPLRISGLRGALGGGRWGSQLGSLYPAGHRLPRKPSAQLSTVPSEFSPSSPSPDACPTHQPRIATAPPWKGPECGLLAGEKGGSPARCAQGRCWGSSDPWAHLDESAVASRATG